MNLYSTKSMMPCAACKLLRRRCTKDCIFLPFFPPSEPDKFAAVHRIFGASNINKMLQDIPMNDRGDAVTSLVFEARARLQEPVYGCVAFISSLQNQLYQLRTELDEVSAETVALKTQLSTALSTMHVSSPSPVLLTSGEVKRRNNDQFTPHHQMSPYDSSYFSDTTPLNPHQVTDSYYRKSLDMYTSSMLEFPSV